MPDTGAPQTSADIYDHQISLFDGTYKPLQPDDFIQRDFASQAAVSPTVTSGSTTLGKSSTTPLSRKRTLREELARRKYAKWQERRAQGGGDLEEGNTFEGDGVSSTAPEGSRVNSRRHRTGSVGISDGPTLGDRRGGRVGSSSKGGIENDVFELDILYENQRGAFFCGLPLYSRNSLLNLDPAPWTNAAFKDSPVDIMTAQPPDPSWDWAWRSWYVDMSADVDEEGWEYSFSFARYFSWHGTHPWFHSFVRRRRWLRKRVKRPQKEEGDNDGGPGSQNTGDNSNGSQRRGSSTLWTKSKSRLSHIGTDVDIQEIRDFDSLMAALRSGRIDREKIEAVSVFLDQAGQDLSLLADHMPEIMSLFVFQASRRQLVARLQRTFDAASENMKHRSEHEDYSNDAEKRRYESLLRAVKAADEEVKGLEYWSDVKEMVQEGETAGGVDTAQGWGPGWQGIDASGPAGPEQDK
ncbi:MAG: hypothetical protein M1816_006361 [Peltula sp. TS41687]|nr:MAG: hypothetical protein M1816_006361 [Peltula sp. TS41687]